MGDTKICDEACPGNNSLEHEKKKKVTPKKKITSVIRFWWTVQAQHPETSRSFRKWLALASTSHGGSPRTAADDSDCILESRQLKSQVVTAEISSDGAVCRAPWDGTRHTVLSATSTSVRRWWAVHSSLTSASKAATMPTAVTKTSFPNFPFPTRAPF